MANRGRRRKTMVAEDNHVEMNETKPEIVTEQVITVETAEKEEVKPQEIKAEPVVLVKTMNRDVVVKANGLKFEVSHISGTGAVHRPKVFFLKVKYSKLLEKLTEEEAKDVEPAEIKEIGELVKQSNIRQMKEYQNSGAKKRKMEQEIAPSEFYG